MLTPRKFLTIDQRQKALNSVFALKSPKTLKEHHREIHFKRKKQFEKTLKEQEKLNHKKSVHNNSSDSNNNTKKLQKQLSQNEISSQNYQEQIQNSLKNKQEQQQDDKNNNINNKQLKQNSKTLRQHKLKTKNSTLQTQNHTLVNQNQNETTRRNSNSTMNSKQFQSFQMDNILNPSLQQTNYNKFQNKDLNSGKLNQSDIQNIEENQGQKLYKHQKNQSQQQYTTQMDMSNSENKNMIFSNYRRSLKNQEDDMGKSKKQQQQISKNLDSSNGIQTLHPDKYLKGLKQDDYSIQQQQQKYIQKGKDISSPSNQQMFMSQYRSFYREQQLISPSNGTRMDTQDCNLDSEQHIKSPVGLQSKIQDIKNKDSKYNYLSPQNTRSTFRFQAEQSPINQIMMNSDQAKYSGRDFYNLFEEQQQKNLGKTFTSEMQRQQYEMLRDNVQEVIQQKSQKIDKLKKMNENQTISYFKSKKQNSQEKFQSNIVVTKIPSLYQFSQQEKLKQQQQNQAKNQNNKQTSIHKHMKHSSQCSLQNQQQKSQNQQVTFKENSESQNNLHKRTVSQLDQQMPENYDQQKWNFNQTSKRFYNSCTQRYEGTSSSTSKASTHERRKLNIDLFRKKYSFYQKQLLLEIDSKQTDDIFVKKSPIKSFYEQNKIINTQSSDNNVENSFQEGLTPQQKKFYGYKKEQNNKSSVKINKTQQKFLQSLINMQRQISMSSNEDNEEEQEEVHQLRNNTDFDTKNLTKQESNKYNNNTNKNDENLLKSIMNSELNLQEFQSNSQKNINIQNQEQKLENVSEITLNDKEDEIQIMSEVNDIDVEQMMQKGFDHTKFAQKMRQFKQKMSENLKYNESEKQKTSILQIQQKDKKSSKLSKLSKISQIQKKPWEQENFLSQIHDNPLKPKSSVIQNKQQLQQHINLLRSSNQKSLQEKPEYRISTIIQKQEQEMLEQMVKNNNQQKEKVKNVNNKVKQLQQLHGNNENENVLRQEDLDLYQSFNGNYYHLFKRNETYKETNKKIHGFQRFEIKPTGEYEKPKIPYTDLILMDDPLLVIQEQPPQHNFNDKCLKQFNNHFKKFKIQYQNSKKPDRSLNNMII